ncbi:MAG TPA: lamin tail domain-containing protein [Polyangiaceae bacterium]
MNGIERKLLAAATLLYLSACGSPLPKRDGAGMGGGQAGAPPDASRPPRLEFDPMASDGAVSRVTRISVVFDRPLFEPRVMLVSGVLGAAQLRDLARATVPQSLSTRALPALAWITADPSVLVVAPLVELEPAAIYSVVVSDPAVAMPFTVAALDAIPVLARVWPDRDDEAPAATAAVWCGASDVGSVDVPVALAPAAVPGRIVLGTGAPFVVGRCISWLALNPTPPLAAVAGSPTALAPAAATLSDGSRVGLEPTMLWVRSDVLLSDAAVCGAAELRFGPGCAEVQDDRILVRPPEAAILWTIDTGQQTIVRSSRGAKRFVVRPMPESGFYRLAVLDRGGRVQANEFPVEPAPARAHVVVNEVMANPAGAEPSQEWVELFNDGTAAVSLGGFVLEDGGGRAVLPDAGLEPGAWALVVPEGYVADDGIDPIAPPDTLVLRVPALGRGGLSNDGEKLTLRDASGAVVSTFPAVKTKNGVSIARASPESFDDDPTAFAPSINGSATPGAQNE